MAVQPVAGEYFQIDGQLLEIKRQLRQQSGYPHSPSALKRALQKIIDGEFGSSSHPMYMTITEYVITDDPFAVVRRQRVEAPRGSLMNDYYRRSALSKERQLVRIGGRLRFLPKMRGQQWGNHWTY